MLPQYVVVALKMENTISGWLSSGKLVAPKGDNIQFLYDKYRSGGMSREQFVARTGSMGVRVEEIGKEMGETEDGIERLKGCGSQEGEAVLEGIAALREFDKGVLRKGIERIRVFGEGQIEVVWKGGDMFGGGDS